MLHEFLKSLQSQIVPRRHIIINSSEKLTVFIYQMLIFNENNRYFRFQSLLILMIKETGKIIPQYFNYTFMYIARRIVVISISMFCNSKISIVLQRSSKFYIWVLRVFYIQEQLWCKAWPPGKRDNSTI